jgi:hypothetical protein
MSLVIARVLIPYGLRVNISPKLSLVLDFNVLVSWYITTLVSEMRSRVDNVMNIWKDRQRDVTGESSFYTSNVIPWIPQRVSNISGSSRAFDEKSSGNNAANSEKFCTNIPEDVISILLTYLSYGKVIIQNQDISSSDFASSIVELNKRIYISFFHSFLYLGNEYYLKELLSFDFLHKLNDLSENEQTEYIIWICSVINDCDRIIHYPFRDLLMKQGVFESIPVELEQEIQGIINVYTKIFNYCIEYISCYIFHLIFYEDDLLHRENFFYIWLHSAVNTLLLQENTSNPLSPTIINLANSMNSAASEAKEQSNTDNNAAASSKLANPPTPPPSSSLLLTNIPNLSPSTNQMEVMKELMSDLLPLLEQIIHYLEMNGMISLIKSSITKVLIIFVYLLRECRNNKINFDSHSLIFSKFKYDYEYVKKTFIDYSTKLLKSAMNKEEEKEDDGTTDGTTNESDLTEKQTDKKITEIIQFKILKHFYLLDNCILLIDEEIMSNQFVMILKLFLQECMNDLKKSFAYYKLIITCMALKGVQECFPKKYRLLDLMGNRQIQKEEQETEVPLVEKQRGASNDKTLKLNSPLSSAVNSPAGDGTTPTNTSNPSATAAAAGHGRHFHFPVIHAIRTRMHLNDKKSPSGMSSEGISSPAQSVSRNSSPTSEILSQSEHQPQRKSETESEVRNSQDNFSNELQGLKQQVGYEWIHSILESIKSHHEQFNTNIDNYHSPQANLVYNEVILKNLAYDDFTPECYVFGLIKKHKFSLQYLLLQNVNIYIHHLRKKEVLLSSGWSSSMAELEESLSGLEEKRYLTNVEDNNKNEGTNNSTYSRLGAWNSFQLWRKSVRKNIFQSNSPLNKKTMLSEANNASQDSSKNAKTGTSKPEKQSYHNRVFPQKLFYHYHKNLNYEIKTGEGVTTSGKYGHSFTQMRVSNLQILGNINFLKLVPSKLYLQIQFNGLIFTTTAKSQYYPQNAFKTAGEPSTKTDSSSSGGCIFDEVFEIPFPTAFVYHNSNNNNKNNESSSSSSSIPMVMVDSQEKMVLFINLYHSGYLLDQLIARTKIEFFMISPPDFRNKVVEFQEWMKTLVQADEANRSVNPKLSLSIQSIE